MNPVNGRTRPETPRADERGFSLVELMIAIVCTVVVGGAIMGMLVAGNSAFRREPALADRQQNIRVAMDLIQKDIAAAGAGMDPWVQAFMPVDPTDGGAVDAKGPVGPDAVGSDHLVIVANSGECPAIGVAPAAPPLAPQRPLPGCYVLPQPIFVRGPIGTYTTGFACDAAATFGRPAIFPQLGAGGLPVAPVDISPIQVVQYLIRIDGPPLGDGQTPNLWRSPTGGVSPAGSCAGAAATDGFQMVARGIEDLQVVYFPWGTAAGAPGVNVPPVVNPALAPPANFNTLVREVEVTLTARALEGNLAGETDPVGAPLPGVPRAFRQQLRSVTSARGALLAVRGQSGNPPSWE